MSIAKSLFRKNPLFFSFLLPMFTDGLMTLIGQSPSYWRNFRTANEMSPAYFFMAAHPIFFIFGAVIWFVLLYFLFRKLKNPYNLILSCIFIAGNTWGSTSWITKLMKESGFLITTDRISIILSWVILVIYFTLIGTIAGLSFSQYFKRKI